MTRHEAARRDAITVKKAGVKHQKTMQNHWASDKVFLYLLF
jgi:hypothetical protein